MLLEWKLLPLLGLAVDELDLKPLVLTGVVRGVLLNERADELGLDTLRVIAVLDTALALGDLTVVE